MILSIMFITGTSFLAITDVCTAYNVPYAIYLFLCGIELYYVYKLQCLCVLAGTAILLKVRFILGCRALLRTGRE